MFLNVRSAYSLLQSTLTIPDYIQLAKQLGYTAIGLADNEVLHGAIQFYNECQKQSISPVIGMYMTLPGVIQSDTHFPILVYALDTTGYSQLVQLSRFLNAPYNTRRTLWDIISNFEGEHLVIISAGRKGEVEQLLIHDQFDEAKQVVQQWQSVVGVDNVYLGMPIYPLNPFEIERLATFAKTVHVDLVMNQLVNTLRKDDAFSLSVLDAIESKMSIDMQLLHRQGVHYIYPKEVLYDMLANDQLEYVIHNTAKLMARCHITIDQDQAFLPKYATPQGITASDYLKHLTYEALEQLDLSQNADYVARLDYELHVISSMGFCDYFLIVWDIMNYCHANAIRTGPGRGSAAGSLVSYLLKITLVDPIRYDLLFERFLNPERYNMPDIDVDIPDDKREQVLKYIEAHYGHQNVAQICTFTTFGAKQSIRDAARVMNATPNELKQWSNAIPSVPNITLKEAYAQSAELRRLVQLSPTHQQIFQSACTIEGLPRQLSTHAAAVVIHETPLNTVVPVIERDNQLLMTQYSMYDIEKIGLLKMDILGLRNLKILNDMMLAVQHIDPSFKLESLDMNDFKTLNLFKNADTNGIFQFESDGIKQVLKRLKPESFEDIVAVNALYRPGPLKQIETFIKRKHGQEPIVFLHESLKPILANTYGIMVYQEQVMKVCQTLASFTLGEADLLRRAMGKKQADVMQRERHKFIQGSIHNGLSEALANQIYDYILEFASYGFNRSHAVVYSTLAYQLAYFKAHYPQVFYQVILNSGGGNKTNIQSYVKEAKQHLHTILGLDINTSEAGFSIHKGFLQTGFASIQGLRKEFIGHIVNDRKQLGQYRDFNDFLCRLPQKLLKIEPLQLLISSGAFDSLGYNRPTLLFNLEKLVQFVKFSGQSMSLFNEISPKIEWQEDWKFLHQIQMERDILGFTLSGHPLDQYQSRIDENSAMIALDQVHTQPIKSNVKTIGLISQIRVIHTKNNELMAFVVLTSEFGEIEGVVFPNVYRQYQALLHQDHVVFVEGKVDHNRDNKKQLIISKLDDPEKHLTPSSKKSTQTIQRVYIKVSSTQQLDSQIDSLKQLAQKHNGPVEVILVNEKRQTFQLDRAYWISYTADVINKVKQIFGHDHVVFK